MKSKSIFTSQSPDDPQDVPEDLLLGLEGHRGQGPPLLPVAPGQQGHQPLPGHEKSVPLGDEDEEVVLVKDKARVAVDKGLKAVKVTPHRDLLQLFLKEGDLPLGVGRGELKVAAVA